jgi:hypothetical protein
MDGIGMCAGAVVMISSVFDLEDFEEFSKFNF